MVKPCLIVKVVKDQMYCSNKTNQLKKFKAQKKESHYDPFKVDETNSFQLLQFCIVPKH